MAGRRRNHILRALPPTTRNTVGAVAFFIGVSIVSGLFGALLLGLLAWLVD